MTNIIRLDIGTMQVTIYQSDPHPSWVKLTINDQPYTLYPADFCLIVDFLNSFHRQYFKPEVKP